MNLRALEPPDALAYRTLRLRGLHDHPDAFTSSFEEENARPPADARQRLSAASQTRMWGAFDGSELAGIFGWSREPRLKNRHKAVLVGMYVAPEFAGRGIGRALIEAVVADAQRAGVELAVLTVTAGNARARALYANAGFQTIGIEPDAIRVGSLSYGKEHMFLRLAT
jgi:ribosomal protein S18 acetylase RimI-like enzyme